MLSTKIRSTIIALAAVTTLTGMAAPLASAQPNQTVSNDTCQQWFSWYQEDLNRANQGVTAGKGGHRRLRKAIAKLRTICNWRATLVAPGRRWPLHRRRLPSA
jgi:hypothetical protein